MSDPTELSCPLENLVRPRLVAHRQDPVLGHCRELISADLPREPLEQVSHFAVHLIGLCFPALVVCLDLTELLHPDSVHRGVLPARHRLVVSTRNNAPSPSSYEKEGFRGQVPHAPGRCCLKG